MVSESRYIVAIEHKYWRTRLIDESSTVHVQHLQNDSAFGLAKLIGLGCAMHRGPADARQFRGLSSTHVRFELQRVGAL